jgi:hypothetical protein
MLGPPRSRTWLEGGGIVQFTFNCPRCVLTSIHLASDGSRDFGRCGYRSCGASQPAWRYRNVWLLIWRSQFNMSVHFYNTVWLLTRRSSFICWWTSSYYRACASTNQRTGAGRPGARVGWKNSGSSPGSCSTPWSWGIFAISSVLVVLHLKTLRNRTAILNSDEPEQCLYSCKWGYSDSKSERQMDAGTALSFKKNRSCTVLIDKTKTIVCIECGGLYMKAVVLWILLYIVSFFSCEGG